MRNAIKLLLNEHIIITSAITIALKADVLIGKNDELYATVIGRLMNFFKNYADSIHHKKENLILFPEMISKNEFLKDGVIKEMYDNHDDFHELINTIQHFIAKKDYLRAQQQLHIYAEALLDHIAVENDEVFQMAESFFDEGEKEKMYFRFIDIDREIGENVKTDLENQVEEIKNLF